MKKMRKVGQLTLRPEVVHGKETGRWFLDIPASLSNTGKRRRPRFENRAAAEKVARHLKEELELKRLGFVVPARQLRLSFRAAVDQWKSALEDEVAMGNIRAITNRTYKIRLNPLLAYFGEQCLAEIDQQAIDRYKVHRIEAGLMKVSINGELRTLRRLMGWHIDAGTLSALPKIRMLKEQRRWWHLPTVTEVLDLIDQLPPAVRILVWLMTETGLRPSEARCIPWAHVDETKGAILIKAYGSYQPKNAHSNRSVYPSENLMRELLRLPRTGAYVFPGADPANPVQNVRAAIKTAATKLDLKTPDGTSFVPSIKLFRKIFATALAEHGVNQSLVASYMGHAPGSKITDQYYTFISEDTKRRNRVSLHALARRPAA